MSEQLKQQTLYNVSEANTKNLIWVDVYVSGAEGSAGTYASRRMTKAQLITFLNSNLSVAWSTISSKPTTLSGYGITDAVDGSGTPDYVSKWSDNNTLTDSTIRDNGTVGINVAPDSLYRAYVKETSGKVAFRAEQSSNGINTNLVSGSFRNNSTNTSTNYSITAFSDNSTTINAGALLEGSSTGSAKSIGARLTATGGLVPRAIELFDGTEGVGKILKCIDSDGGANWTYMPAIIQLAVSDEITALTTGTGKITFRMPHAMTLTEVRASLTTAQTSGNILTIDVNESGSSILSTKVTINNAQKTSVTATTASVISDSSLADDSEITIDIDQVGDGTAKGLKITLIGTRTI